MSSYLSHRRKGFQGGVTAFDGFGNRSRSFNGVDDYISIADNADIPTGAQTIAFWMKLNTLTELVRPLTKFGTSDDQRSFLFVILTDGTIKNVINDTGSPNDSYPISSAASTISTGIWYHVAMRFIPSTEQTLYINGSSVASDTTNIPSQIFNSTAPIMVGSDPLFASYFDGNVADIRIYDTDLTSTDISDLYNGTNVTTNLVGHWLTDADNLLDAAGTNHGTNYGSKYSYDNPSPPVEFGRASRIFNGTSDYLTVADGSWIPTGAQTWACWVKLDTTGLYSFFNHNGGFPNKSLQILVLSGGKFRLQVSDNGDRSENLDSTTIPTTGTWYHVACVFNPALSSLAKRIYVNGTLESTNSTGYSSLNDTSVDIGIGANSAGEFKLDGNMADCRIYDADIGDSAIADLAAGTDYQTNLVGWWLTDSDDVEDKAGANDGTNFGSTYDYDAPFTEVTLPNHYWDLSDTGTYADSGKLASAGWDLNEYSSVNSSVQNIGTSTKTVLDTISGGVLEYKNGTNVDVGWDSESKEISMACWFYCTAIKNSGNWLISWRGDGNDNRIAQIFIRNQNGLHIFRGALFDAQGDSASTPQSGTSISLNTWYHGAMTWDNTTIKTYINGELFATGTNASVDGFGTNPVGCEFAIGRGAWDKTGNFSDHYGYTFGAGVWDVALTESQIKALYNDGNALDYSETTWR